MILPLLLLALLHVFVEVQPRYHIPFVPLLCMLSALAQQALHGAVADRSARRRP
jgi:hypothetical protein